MDSQRNLFLIALLFVSFMIWQSWQIDQNQQFQRDQIVQNKVEDVSFIQQNASAIKQNKNITVKTDVLFLTISTRGGDVLQAQLLAYPNKLRSSQPFQLLETSPSFLYQAQSGLIGKNGIDNPENNIRPLFSTIQNHFTLANDQNELRIPMKFTSENSVIYIKTFILKRGEYTINVEYQIINTTENPLEIAMFGQLKQSINLPKDYNIDNNFSLHTFRGAAYSSIEEKYKKYKFNTIADNENLNIKTYNGWVAMLQQYFATAWIPQTKGINVLYTTNNLEDETVSIGYKSEPVIVKPGDQQKLNATLWIGPEILDKMEAAAPYLDLIIDYGWLWFISQPLFKLLKFLHSFIGNWGFSIIIITFILRGIMYPLTKAQYTSMARMRMLQPKIQEIYERLEDNKERLSKEIMDLYKSEKVNPFGGCLPLIIQMPIFLSLYYMLISSVELRHAPFLLWIRDLSSQDPYYILPILMGMTMFFIQKLSPITIADPMQQKVMTFMPIIFTGFFLWFPSGLVLYYIVSNLFTILQQQFIYRSLEKQGLHNSNI